MAEVGVQLYDLVSTVIDGHYYQQCCGNNRFRTEIDLRVS
jgi:hypothetical protein